MMLNIFWLLVFIYAAWVYYRKVRLHVSFLQKMEAWEKENPKPQPEKEPDTQPSSDPWGEAYKLFGDPSLTMPAWLLLIHYQINDPELEALRKRINRMTTQLYVLFFVLLTYMALLVLGLI